MPPDSPAPAKATGLRRLWPALRYSLAGLRAAWGEPAFRQEAALALVLVPAAFWLGRNWVETALLAGVCPIVMVAELLNSAVAAAIVRIGAERHPLSARAKDLGSAAVLLALLLAAGVWLAAICARFL